MISDLPNDFEYSLDMEVRDYECDYQGVVNNSVYLNYLEHARHNCIKEHINVPQLSREHGIDLVLSEINLKYKSSLRPGQSFRVYTRFYLQGLFRLIFEQDIYRISSEDSSKGELVLLARPVVAAVAEGRPLAFKKVEELSKYRFAQAACSN